jgi:hypothetical protein
MSDSLEPKVSVKELKEQRTVIFTGPDGREYQADLPGSWSNAKVAATDVDKVCEECRDSPHFDTEAHGKGFVLAWRLYAEKEHPRWKIADGCGCGCGCYSAEEPKPAQKSARNSKPTRKGARPKTARK